MQNHFQQQGAKHLANCAASLQQLTEYNELTFVCDYSIYNNKFFNVKEPEYYVHCLGFLRTI